MAAGIVWIVLSVPITVVYYAICLEATSVPEAEVTAPAEPGVIELGRV